MGLIRDIIIVAGQHGPYFKKKLCGFSFAVG